MSRNDVKRGSWRTLAAGGMLVVLAGCTAAPGSGCSPEAEPSTTTTSTTTIPGPTTTEAPGSTTTTEPGSSSTTTPTSSTTTTVAPGSTTTTTLPDGDGEVVAVDEISVGDCVTPLGDDVLVQPGREGADDLAHVQRPLALLELRNIDQVPGLRFDAVDEDIEAAQRLVW